MSPAREVLAVALDTRERRELLLALAQRQRALRADGATLPPALFALAEALAGIGKVTSGQGGSTLDAAADDVDAHPVLAPLAVTFTAAAAAIGVSTSTVKRLVTAGQLPTVKVMGRTLVRTADLAGFVASLPPTRQTQGAPIS